MPNASIKKIIPCKKKNLIDMILDIEKYPEFIPWCISSKIYRKDEMNDMVEIEADLTVGKKFINQISGKYDTKERIGGTVSSCIQAYLQGVQILRVHDIKEINQAFKVFKELQN